MFLTLYMVLYGGLFLASLDNLLYLITIALYKYIIPCRNVSLTDLHLDIYGTFV